MVLEKPRTAKKLAKIELLKTNSDHLIHPLKESLSNTEEISVTKDAMQILKYHGSYMQTDREKKGKPKDYQFMLRLKQPAGELPPTSTVSSTTFLPTTDREIFVPPLVSASRCTESSRVI